MNFLAVTFWMSHQSAVVKLKTVLKLPVDNNELERKEEGSGNGKKN